MLQLPLRISHRTKCTRHKEDWTEPGR